MKELEIKVPPEPILEEAFEYGGSARYIALWWEIGGDEAMVSDGRVTYTSSWEAYLLFVRRWGHVLGEYQLGSSDEVARDRLIIDRQNRKAFVLPCREANTLLYEQWPQSEPVRLTEEQWKELVQQIEAEMGRTPSAEEFLAQWNKSRATLAALNAWLNQN